MTTNVPTSDLDYYADDFILDPYPVYKRLRDLAPAIWLNRYDMWFVGRFKDVNDSLRNAEVFCSSKGVTMNPEMNAIQGGNMLMSDDPEHAEMRRVYMEPLSPKALREIREMIQVTADEHIEKLVQQKKFDTVRDLSWFLPLTIVRELVGLDEEGRANMLEWAAGAFDAFGAPSTARAQQGMTRMKELANYVQTKVTRDMLAKDGFADRLFTAADEGRIPPTQPPLMMFDYIIPSLDTTINATSNAIWLFSQNPDQWDLLRENPDMIPRAINEIVRMDPPIRAFSRVLTRDFDMDGVLLKEGDRAILSYSSGSHDERHFEDPEKFDITRKNAADHLGFGKGVHTCAGANLARLEIRCVLESLMKRVVRFECEEPVRVPHNTLRGIASLPTTVH